MKILRFAAFLFFLILFMFGSVYAHPAEQEAKTGTISGQFMIKGEGPMSGGIVFFFSDSTGPPPSYEKYWRIPDYSANVDKEGRFSIEVPEGKYYIGAIKRVQGREIGPPQDGDLFYILSDEKGRPRPHAVKKSERIDIGVISEAITFKKSVVKYKDGITAIEGIILGAEGKPVEGILVYAFVTPAMIGRPLFVSDRTEKDGRYIIRVHEGGEYYLKARDIYGGGPPVKGAVIGGYGEESPVAVTAKTGEVTKGIDIKVIKFPGRGPGKE